MFMLLSTHNVKDDNDNAVNDNEYNDDEYKSDDDNGINKKND